MPEILVEWKTEVAKIEWAAGRRGGSRILVLDPGLPVRRAMEIIDEVAADQNIVIASDSAVWTRVSRKLPFVLSTAV